MDPASSRTAQGIDRALDHLIESGEIGVVLLDDSLIALETRGVLARSVPIGAPIDEGLPYLAGLAPDLLNMQDEPDAAFLLSNVGIAGAEKVNIEAFWQPGDRRYCLLIHKLGLRTAPEAEIIKQIKSRRIAEQHLQQTRRALAEQTALTEILSEAAPVALAVIDQSHHYLFATMAWRDLFDLGLEPVAGRALTAGFPDGWPFPPEAIERAAAGQAVRDQETIGRIGGREKSLRYSAVPWRRGDGPPRGVLLVASEHDGEQAQAAALSKRVAHLEDANRTLEEIIAIAAHDLEAQRRAIDRALEAAEPFALAQIGAHSQRLKVLLSELLEHTRLAGGPVPFERVDIAAVARGALAVAGGGVNFKITLDPPVAEVTTLKLPFETIVRNLVANAVRHHDRGSGTIVLKLEELGAAWRLSVSDDGPGIPPAGRTRIFEAFQQLETGAAKGGVGLGLALVASAARRLGGAISVTDRPDGARGACFALVWPKSQDR